VFSIEADDIDVNIAPRTMSPFVCSITAHDTPLFMFHHNTRCLYGVFEATRYVMTSVVMQSRQCTNLVVTD
jgi:hypothetical protein